MYLKKVLGVSLLSSLLVACNNSGTSNDTAESGSPADKAYLGERTEATLTIANVSSFVRSAFAVREFSFSASSLSTLLPNASIQKPTGSINTTTTCTNEGQATDFGEINDISKLGLITTGLKQCLLGDTVFDGVIKTQVSSYDIANKQASAFSVTFEQLSMSKAAKSITLIGQLDTQKDSAKEILKSNLNVHMKAHSGEEVFADLQTDVSKGANYAISSTLTGKICVDTQGCANIQTVNPFIVGYDGVLSTGELTVIGAEASRAKIKLLAQNRIQIEVDKDGDGVYEDKQIVNQ